MKIFTLAVAVMLSATLFSCKSGDPEKVTELEGKVATLESESQKYQAALGTFQGLIQFQEQRHNERLEMDAYLKGLKLDPFSLFKSKLRKCLDECRAQESADVQACRTAYPKNPSIPGPDEILGEIDNYDDCIRNALNRGSNCEWACRQEHG